MSIFEEKFVFFILLYKSAKSFSNKNINKKRKKKKKIPAKGCLPDRWGRLRIWYTHTRPREASNTQKIRQRNIFQRTHIRATYREKYVGTHIHHKGLNEIHPICITFQRPIRSRRAVHIHLPREGGKESRFEFSSIFLLFFKKRAWRKKKIKPIPIQCYYFPTHTPSSSESDCNMRQKQSAPEAQCVGSSQTHDGGCRPCKHQFAPVTSYTTTLTTLYTHRRNMLKWASTELCFRNFRWIGRDAGDEDGGGLDARCTHTHTQPTGYMNQVWQVLSCLTAFNSGWEGERQGNDRKRRKLKMKKLAELEKLSSSVAPTGARERE